LCGDEVKCVTYENNGERWNSDGWGGGECRMKSVCGLSDEYQVVASVGLDFLCEAKWHYLFFVLDFSSLNFFKMFSLIFVKILHGECGDFGLCQV